MAVTTMKVLIVSSLFPLSKDEVAYSFIFDEAYKLAKMGINVHIIRSKVEDDSFLYGIHYHGLKRRIDIHAIVFMLRNLPTYPLISLLRKPMTIYRENLYAVNVLRLLKEKEIDLIHAHFAYPEGWVGLLAKRMTNKPLIVTTYGYDIQVERSINYGMRLNRSYNALVERVVKGADIAIVISTYNYRLLTKIGVKPEKIKLVHMGVDLDRFNPHLDRYLIRHKLGIDSKAYVIFCLKSGVRRYGTEYLIKSVPSILSKAPNTIFIIGGNTAFMIKGRKPLSKYYLSLCKKLGILKSVIFAGNITSDELPYFYATCNIYVNPSIIEGFGIVTTEAMACSKPVIGTNAGGTTDLIKDEVNGFLVKPKDPISLADKIIFLLKNSDLRRKMGIKGRKIVEEKFNIEKRINKILEIYSEFSDLKVESK